MILGAMLFLCLYILYKRKENTKMDNDLSRVRKISMVLCVLLCNGYLVILKLFYIDCLCIVNSSPSIVGCSQILTIGIRVVVGFKGMPSSTI
jgi:hypothetical protein